MKKLLGFLGTITIAGGGMAGIVANSPIPQIKQESFSKFVTSIGVLQKDSSNPTIKSGSVWVGTQNGVYFKYSNDINQGKIYSVGGINEQVTSITVDSFGGAYFLTVSGKLYYCGSGPNDWTAQQINVNDKVVTSIGVLQKDSSNPTIKSGSVWVGTQNGVYFKYSNDINQGKIYSVGGINEQVTSITVDSFGGAYFLTVSGKLYYCGSGPNDWTAQQIN